MFPLAHLLQVSQFRYAMQFDNYGRHLAAGAARCA